MRAAEGRQAAVVKAVSVDGAGGGSEVKAYPMSWRSHGGGDAGTERTTLAEVTDSGAGGGSEVKAYPMSWRSHGGGDAGTERTTRAKRPPKRKLPACP